MTKLFLRYEAGDHLAIYPTNDTEAVNSLGKILNVDLDEIFSLQNIDGKLTNKLKTNRNSKLFHFRWLKMYHYRDRDHSLSSFLNNVKSNHLKLKWPQVSILSYVQ